MVIFDTSGSINAATDPSGRNGGYRNTQGGFARGAEFSVSVAATRSLQLTGAYTYTDARQQTPLVAGVWRTYKIPQHFDGAFDVGHIPPSTIDKTTTGLHPKQRVPK